MICDWRLKSQIAITIKSRDLDHLACERSNISGVPKANILFKLLIQHKMFGDMPKGAMQEHATLRRVCLKILRRVLRRCPASAFSERKASQKGSQKGVLGRCLKKCLARKLGEYHPLACALDVACDGTMCSNSSAQLCAPRGCFCP